MADVLEPTGLCMVEEYIQRQQATITAQVACRSIYELFTGAEWMPWSSRLMRWWEQDVVREEEEPGVKCSLNLIV